MLNFQILEKVVFECLMNTHAAQLGSIAFPVFGTGNLLYPWGTVAKTMIHTIQKYARIYFDTTVKEVKIVLYEKDQKSIEVTTMSLHWNKLVPTSLKRHLDVMKILDLLVLSF